MDDTLYREDVAAGIGYNDGYVGDKLVSLPKLWKYWDWDARLYYIGGFWYARYFYYWRSLKKPHQN